MINTTKDHLEPVHSDSNFADEVSWAVRVIDSPSLHHHELSLQRIQQLCNLTHPNILPLRISDKEQIREDNYRTYVELPSTKKSLLDVIYEHRNGDSHISEDQILQYTDAVVTGLAYLHSKQLTHNDLKPSIVVFSTDHDAAKLVCIGSKSLLSENQASSFLENIGLYTPPEMMIDDDNQTEKQNDLEARDLWSLGVLLLELCLCKFTGSNLDTKVQARENIINQCLNEVSKVYHKELVDIISKLLNQSPSARGTAKATKEDIDEILVEKSKQKNKFVTYKSERDGNDSSRL